MSDQAVAKPKIKHDWYQTESQVIITILLKNVSCDNVNVRYGKTSLSVSSTIPESKTEYNLKLTLAHKIEPTMCNYIVSPFKIEIKLKKAENLQWTNLEGDGKQDNIKASPQAVGEASGLPATLKYPSSSPVTKDWDKIARDIEKEMKEDKAKVKPRGPAALNQLVQKIYGQGSDDVKRALNKSFLESRGTLLSTNWEKVQKEKMERKPDEDREWE